MLSGEVILSSGVFLICNLPDIFAINIKKFTLQIKCSMQVF